MDVKELFEKNYTNQEIANELGISRSSVKRKLSKLGLTRTQTQRSMILSRKVKEAVDDGRMTYKYGDDNPACRPEVRKKISEGVNRRMDAIKRNREATMLERYGVDNPFKANQVKEKIRQTNLKRYGYESPAQNAEIKKRIIENEKLTLARKYQHMQRISDLKEMYKRLGRKLTPKEMIELWGCTQANAYLFLHKHKLEDYVQLGSSELEMQIEHFLMELGVSYIKNCRSVITPQEIDFYIPEFKLGIEANDIYTHNSNINTKGGKPKSKDYHFKKSMACEEKGVRLIHIWDYEWYNKRQQPILKSIIAGACNQSEKIYARKCTVEITESKKMKKFFEENNIQGFRGGKYAINLLYKGEVVMSYIIGFPFFGKGKYEWEVIRGATKLNCRVIGGATRIWKHFIKEFKPKSCVYYIDYNYFNGNSVGKLGLRYICTRPSFKNYFVREKKVRNRQPAKHQEIQELVKNGDVWVVHNAGVKVYLYEQ